MIGWCRRRVLPGSSLGAGCIPLPITSMLPDLQDCMGYASGCQTSAPYVGPGHQNHQVLSFVFFSPLSQCEQDSWRGVNVMDALSDCVTAFMHQKQSQFWLKSIFCWWDEIKAAELQNTIWAGVHPHRTAEELGAAEHPHQWAQWAWLMNGTTGQKATSVTASGTSANQAHVSPCPKVTIRRCNNTWEVRRLKWGWTNGNRKKLGANVFFLPSTLHLWKKILSELHCFHLLVNCQISCFSEWAISNIYGNTVKYGAWTQCQHECS